MIALLLTCLLPAGVATLALRRDLQRADQRRRIREAMHRGGKFTALQRAFEEMARQIGAAFLPALRQGALALSRLSPRLALPEPHRWYYPSDPRPCRCPECAR